MTKFILTALLTLASASAAADLSPKQVDIELNRVYKQALAKNPDIKKTQRAWLLYANGQCVDFEMARGAISPEGRKVNEEMCFAYKSQERIEELKSLL